MACGSPRSTWSTSPRGRIIEYDSHLHADPEQRRRDARKDAISGELGLGLIRLNGPDRDARWLIARYFANSVPLATARRHSRGAAVG